MDRKPVWVGVGLFALVVVAILTAVFLARPPQYYATAYEPKPAPEIVLPLRTGGSFHLSDLKGRIVLLFFGFTNCPDICPTTLANLRQVVTQLSPDAAPRVQVVFITVDPDRDTPARAQEYASQFDPSFIGLSGSTAELEQVWSRYGVYRELGASDAAGNYSVTHTARVTVIDPKGNLRLSINYDATWPDILHDVQILLDER
jgi:protein SCO1/2